MKIKGVIFDADGTLLDSMPLWMEAGSRWLCTKGIEPKPGLEQILFSMTMDQGADYLKEAYSIPMEKEEIKEEVNAMVRQAYWEEIPVKPGVREMLQWLKEEGIPATVATATDYELIGGALERLQLLPCFQKVYTCTEVGKGKESPLIFQKAADTMGTCPEETLVVEDAIHALLTAKKAGFLTAAVFDAASEKEQERLRAEGTFYAENMADLLKQLKEREERI